LWGCTGIKEKRVNFDFYPSLCEFSGTQLPEKQFIDGKSLVPLLAGKNIKQENPRVFYWHYPLEKKHFLGGRSAGAIREGDWKLIEFFDTGEKELYNLRDDLGETKNIASENPEKVNDLQQKLILWRENVINKGFK